MVEKKNPMVFMDVSIDEVPIGRMEFLLFKELAPATVENFHALCTGERGIGPKTGLPLHYKGSYFYDIQSGGSYVKGGDLASNLGTCGESIYGENFPNETTGLKCDQPGLLCMNIGDRYGIGSHFVITLKPNPKLERFHVVFGRLVKGFDTLDQITKVPLGSKARVMDCGEYNEDESECSSTQHKRKKRERERMNVPRAHRKKV